MRGNAARANIDAAEAQSGVAAAGNINGAADGGNSVDFVRKLSNEYSKLRGEYMKLSEEYKKLEQGGDRDAIASALIEAEVAAKQIVDKAKFEAFQTVDAAKKECEALCEDAKRKRSAAAGDLRGLYMRIGELVSACEGKQNGVA